jgi:hypothetical protein
LLKPFSRYLSRRPAAQVATSRCVKRMVVHHGCSTAAPRLLHGTSARTPVRRRSLNQPGKGQKMKATYNTGYSLVVTDPTTNPALPGLSRGERTGSRVSLEVWSYVLVWCRVPSMWIVLGWREVMVGRQHPDSERHADDYYGATRLAECLLNPHFTL